MQTEQTLPEDLADTVIVVMRDSEGQVMVRAGEVVLGKVPTSVLHWACALSQVSMGGCRCLWCPPAEPCGSSSGGVEPPGQQGAPQDSAWMSLSPKCPPPAGRPPGSHQATAAWQPRRKSREWPGSHCWSAESARNHCQRAHSRPVV